MFGAGRMFVVADMSDDGRKVEGEFVSRECTVDRWPVGVAVKYPERAFQLSLHL